jgi:hypothetical protein
MLVNDLDCCATNVRGGNVFMADGAILWFRTPTSTRGTTAVSELSSPGQAVRLMVFNALKADSASGPSG